MYYITRYSFSSTLIYNSGYSKKSNRSKSSTFGDIEEYKKEMELRILTAYMQINLIRKGDFEYGIKR